MENMSNQQIHFSNNIIDIKSELMTTILKLIK